MKKCVRNKLSDGRFNIKPAPFWILILMLYCYLRYIFIQWLQTCFGIIFGILADIIIDLIHVNFSFYRFQVIGYCITYKFTLIFCFKHWVIFFPINWIETIYLIYSQIEIFNSNLIGLFRGSFWNEGVKLPTV